MRCGEEAEERQNDKEERADKDTTWYDCHDCTTTKIIKIRVTRLHKGPRMSGDGWILCWQSFILPVEFVTIGSGYDLIIYQYLAPFLSHRKYSTGKFFGGSTHGILTHTGFRNCIWKVGTTNFWPCFGRPKLDECEKMGSVSKIMRRHKKIPLPQFSNLSFQI